MKGRTQRDYYTQKGGPVQCDECELVVNNSGAAALATAPDMEYNTAWKQLAEGGGEKMDSVNPVVIYYDILLMLSVVLTGVYMFMWHKHFDVHITMVFVLVPVECLGYALLVHSSVLSEALAANRIIYLGGCFLQLIVLLVICSLCDIRPRWGRAGRILKTLAFALSTAVFVYVLNPMNSGDFYTHAELEIRNGLPLLHKEYGWMHTAFHVMVIAYYAVSVVLIIYCFIRKNQVSRKILAMLFFPESLAIIAFFIGRKVIGDIELLPLTYVVAQITYLAIVSRVNLYDITDTAIDSLVQRGETGFISIDYGYRYLGSNETAKEVFPILRELTVDRTILRRKSFADLVIPWLRQYGQDPDLNTASYTKDDRFYQISIAPLYTGRRKKGYQLTVTDNTKDQRFLRIIQRKNEELNILNERLEDKVAEKTAHLEEMHDKLILGLATMVESRDNSTGGHIRRTSVGVKILLREMSSGEFPELTDDFREKLIKAAPMHDLGKIAVPDQILQKPGRFTPEEFGEMKKHAPEGARIVHEILKGTDDKAFHIIAENVAHYHHERWDGSGYPDGLKGEEIPLEARIMAIADVYDALVSKRVYKESMSFGKADRIMMEGMGTQFAPEMKEVYCRARPKLEAYYESMDD